jgi:hypothetical protein
VLKKIRKHNKWLMVGFGVLLMVTWLVQPALNQFNSAVQNRVVAKLDGDKITAKEWSQASSEVKIVADLIPGVANALGLSAQDPVHWLILSKEAEAAGVIGGPQDGETWTEPIGAIAMRLAFDELSRQFGPEFAMQILRQMPNQMDRYADQAKSILPQRIDRAAADNHFSRQQVHTALSKARGVVRLYNAYRAAARVSDRRAMLDAKSYLYSAKASYVFIPAQRLIDSVPDPDAAALQDHFDLYKTVKPGEGEYGVGYLLPPRVKLEYLKLDRPAIEASITLDPIEVSKRYNAGKGGKYPGAIAVERPRIEAEIRTEVTDRVFQEAHVAIQTEILKATKILEPEGKYKKLPADWEARRPRFENIAAAVVDAVRRATGVTIPLPSVTVKGADWLTRNDLRALPDIGRSQLRAGGFQINFDDVVFWTRELGAADSLIPVQTGVPLTETFLTDQASSRYYLTVLATKGESAPDTIDEKRELIVKDYKSIKAFEQLKSRAEELRTKAVAGGASGLDSIIAEFPAATPPAPADPTKPDTDPKFKPLDIAKDVAVTTDVGAQVFGSHDPIMTTEEVSKAVLEAAQKIDPLLPREQVPADAATLAVPISKRLGVAVIRILNPDPVTTEKYRRYENFIVRTTLSKEFEEVSSKPENSPFSFENLLKRHTFTRGDKSIRTPDDLNKD